MIKIRDKTFALFKGSDTVSVVIQTVSDIDEIEIKESFKSCFKILACLIKERTILSSLDLLDTDLWVISAFNNLKNHVLNIGTPSIKAILSGIDLATLVLRSALAYTF
ncbi:unnamed protein product [Blepharisma stoltei]|uniref:Uncharacterized protein n=1 Tax=Blepharisma stoltei TaxID=1481888 RepID=A0AAU9IV16_9CILI|nr:unnamed protein product [Blepharisma stoltei]